MGGPAVAGVAALLALIACVGAQVAAFAWPLAWLRKRLPDVLGPSAAATVTLLLAAAWWTALEYVFVSWCAWSGLVCYVSLGCSQWPSAVLVQNASWGGMYAVSFVLVLVSAGAALAIRDGARGWRLLGVPAAVAALSVAGGYWRVAAVQAVRSDAKPVRVALLQADVAPARTIDSHLAAHVAERHLSLLPQVREAKPELVVWSECAVPWLIREDDDLVGCMVGGLQPLNPFHLVGTISDAPPGSKGVHRNTAYVLLPDGRIIDQYHKVRPVLFAETGPCSMGSWLRARLSTAGEEALVAPGCVLRAVASPVGPIGVTICNEVLYPDMSRRLAADGAELMVNMANGAWLCGNWARRQHFSAVVLRAVETGRDTLVANNSGISGVIDASGRLTAAGAPHAHACVGAVVHRRTAGTAYLAGRDWFAATCLVLSLLVFAGAGVGYHALGTRPHRTARRGRRVW
jgi:apolipoprotein N-acyltransferase